MGEQAGLENSDGRAWRRVAVRHVGRRVSGPPPDPVLNVDERHDVYVYPSTITWPQVLARLDAAANYWLNTISSDGAPHAAPVWGAAAAGTLYLYTERSSVKARNLGGDPRAVVHLESAEDVVIVHAVLDDVGHPVEFPTVLTALAHKYDDPQDAQYLPPGNPDFDVLYAVRPLTALLWRLNDYENSQERWRA